MRAAAPQIEVRVAEIRQVASKIKRFRLEPTDGNELPPFGGGAHVLVEIMDGPTLRRNAYSLMGDPRDRDHYMISVLRHDDGRGGSVFLHDRLERNSILKINYPVNLFPTALHANKHLFIAGGIGITPFVAMMRQLNSESKSFELHYAARRTDDAAYAAELSNSFGSRVRLHFSTVTGRLNIRNTLQYQPLGTHLYVCGPEGLIDEVLTHAASLGWPKHNIHLERFLAPAIGVPYEVELRRSGKTISVGAAQSMLEAIEAAGVNAPFLCRGGACGQCETQVVLCDGQLIHADHFLNDEEKAAGSKVMPCVSRFRGRKLALDI